MSEGDAEAEAAWARLSEWIQCVCVVTFDLELGQALESTYPPHAAPGEPERANLCYLAFPDSNSNCMGDTRFHVRLRAARPLSEHHQRYNRNAPVTLHADPTHLWGFVYFRQVRDPGLPRGYFQKSVVLLTRLPFVNFMYKLCGLIAPRFFDTGLPGIETACHDINRWPSLLAADSFRLPVLGRLLHLFIPSCDASEAAIAPEPGALSVSPRDLYSYSSLSLVLSDLHLLWELALTAEPIVVMAPSPTVCSAMVQALVDLVRPLRYCAEFRPYFTIHDSEFKEFTEKRYSPPFVLLGVTNPFFSKTLDHWPHTIRLTDDTTSKPKSKRSASKQDVTRGVYTNYKTFLTKDKSILKRLASERPAEAQSALVRRHVLELTQSFMIPLERYMASLMPLQKNISPFRAAPSPRPFNPDEFLETLGQAGPRLTSGVKGDWVGLYRSFLKSPNFAGWFQRRYSELARTLQALQLEALAATDLSQWAAGRQEVELVDMVLRLRKTTNAETDLPVKPGTTKRLAEKLEEITRILPEDLKSILQNNT